MSSRLQKLLSQVEHTYKGTIDSQSKSVGNGNAFNVFNVIGLWSEEVRLHSAMIKELLDPSGSHGCSDRFLRLFYDKVYNSPIPEEKSLAKAIVEAEYYIGPISDDKNDGGRIDILVMVPKELDLPSLIIENKIYALDQENQLLRYYNFGNREGEDQYILTYLTLYGNEPSEFSKGDCSSIKPVCISYNNHIVTWLQSCAQIAFDKPKVRETIIQYIDLLKQITEYTMTKSDEIVNIVASSTENLVSGLQICARRNEIVKSAVMGPIKTFLKDIAIRAQKDMNHVQVQFKPNDDFNTKGVKVDWGFEFLITSSVGKQQVCLKYIFDNWDLCNLYYGIDKAQTSVGVQASNIFGNPSDDWPWGWKWMKGAYKNWDCDNICTILEQITMNDLNSDFAKEVIMAIKTASKLLNEAN